MKRPTGWRLSLYNVIFGYDSIAGKTFDICLIIAIVLSVLTVMLDSVESIHHAYEKTFIVMEWFFTIIFTLEYIARLVCVGKPIRYVLSFYGIIDLLSTLPTYLALIFPPAFFLVDIRIIRLLRIFRILKLTRYMKAAKMLKMAIFNSTAKITVFLFVVLTLVIIAGTLMYLIEGNENGFSSIPESVYWAIVTMTTVGYGDIAPQSPFGRILASILMILGYGLIAVPTGIVGMELADSNKIIANNISKSCNNCTLEIHDEDARFCKRCGNNLA